MFCLVYKVLCRAVVSLQSCFDINMFYRFVKNALCSGFTKNKQRQNCQIQYAFSLIFVAIAKISTREIRLLDSSEIMYARKLVKIR